MQDSILINLIPYPVAILNHDSVLCYNTAFDICFRRNDVAQIRQVNDLVISESIVSLIDSMHDNTIMRRVKAHKKFFDMEIKTHVNTGELVLFATERTAYYQLVSRFNFVDSLVRTLIDILPHFIFWKNSKSVFLGCNRKFAHSAKFKAPREIINKTDHDMPWSKNADKFMRDDQDVIFSGTPKLRYNEVQTKETGEERVMQVDKVPIIVEDEVQGILGVYEDVTEVSSLKNDIQMAIRDKNQSTQFVADFVLNMQHDIRTPLTGIIGLGEIIASLDGQDINVIQSASKDIVASGKRLLSYCEAMVDYHKINQSGKALVGKRINVAELIGNIVDMQRPAMKVKNLSMTTNIYPADACVISDFNRIERILVNIVSNAVKFTEKGGITIHAEVTTLEESRKALLTIVVEDTGPGIKEENINILFEHFAKEVPSFRSAHQGMGLGLRMVKILTEDLNGDINVESFMGKGSTFTIDIPVTLPLKNIFNQQPQKEPVK